ncbi:thiolase family protein [Actinomadura sp. LD22]|uniref:Thiolase family protein n=1 Tax=Actinomadura physcomitrii TaxID=2650748 RepID=A0A6I4MKP5_9ACTN|nr:thiolase family protein [Actinomadura physcomitrii]MWA03279.1 thiolase family protein [Actinomadura physcomitrii]
MTERAAHLRDVFVAGVGTTPFGKHLDRTLGSLAGEAADAAVRDAACEYGDIEMVVFSNAAEGVLSGQEMIRGQVALKDTPLAGLPLFNTENACASGSAAAHLAWLAVAAGQVDRAIAIGAEKLFHPDKNRSFAAIESGTDRSLNSEDLRPGQGSVMMGAYAAEARAYAAEFGDVDKAMAAIAVKNRRFAAGNPHAQFRSPITVADVQAGREVAAPLRLLTCSPLTDGAAAIVFSAERPRTGDRPGVVVTSCRSVSNGPAGPVVERAARAAYEATGLSVHDIDVFQLHDASAFAELLQYEQIGIAAKGEGIAAALDGRTGPGGDMPVNTDGGLLSRGHALGATGLAQLGELARQLRGEAGERQVPGARRALSVNSGGWMGDDYATAFATILTRR